MNENIMDLQIKNMTLEIELEKYKQKCKSQEKRIEVLNDLVIQIVESDMAELNYIIKKFEEYTIDKNVKNILPLIDIKARIKVFAEQQKQTRENLMLMMRLEEELKNKNI